MGEDEAAAAEASDNPARYPLSKLANSVATDVSGVSSCPPSHGGAN